VVVPEFVSAQIEERIDRSRLIVRRPHDFKVLPEEFEQLWRVGNLVFFDGTRLEQVEDSQEHDWLVRPFVISDTPDIESAKLVGVEGEGHEPTLAQVPQFELEWKDFA
jgi:hypothetical protein